MSENLNKIVTNYPVTLTQEEVENLSKTLSAVVTSGSEGYTYDGDGKYIGVDNTNNKISLLSDAANTLDQVYTNGSNWDNSYSTLTSNSGKWEDATSAYQTNSGTYLTTANSAEYYPMTGNPSGFMTEMFMATYGQTSYQDIKDAYNAHKIVYCHVPNTTGDRMAFLAFVGSGNSGNFEFQYYRSLTPNKRPSDVFGDELYTYICNTTASNTWTSARRYTCSIISAGEGLYSNYTTASDKGYFTLNLSSDYVNAITSVSSKVDKPASLVDKYLVLRTDSNGDVSGWCDFQDQSYSKSEALGTFVATANIDTTTLSGDGKSVNTKLGVRTDVIATKDYVNSSFLPLSGGTVSGKLTVSGSDFDHSLEIIRGGENTSASTGQIGINGAGGLSFKINRENNNTQLNVSPTGTLDKRFSIGDNPYQPSAYFIPAVTSTTTAGLTNDGILHIILES